MVESPRRVDLRLTIPAAAPYREVAVELAVKFAEYAGASQAATADVAKAIEAALGGTHAGGSIEIEMAAQGNELVLTTNPGSSARPATFPLVD
jgi:hypothetical protein